MKISRTLPQFDNSQALIIVSGKLGADFYFAHKGSIRKIDGVSIEKTAEKNRLSKGSLFDDRFLLEPRVSPSKHLRSVYLKRLDTAVQNAMKRTGAKELYMFAPGYVMRGLWNTLSDVVREALQFAVRGNYKGKHTFEILEKIRRVHERDNEAVRDWQKLLNPDTKKAYEEVVPTRATRSITLASMLRY